MPPAGSGRPLHPRRDCRPESQTRSRCSLESASGTTHPLEAEWNAVTMRQVPAGASRPLLAGIRERNNASTGSRMERSDHEASARRGFPVVTRWNPRAEQRIHWKPNGTQ
ncbi:MAG: hypothetical protein LBQ54_11555 [Planctomycetaceae bacterium]|nr:hypothetical protein [Planctomycetaceae bacterium]